MFYVCYISIEILLEMHLRIPFQTANDRKQLFLSSISRLKLTTLADSYKLDIHGQHLLQTHLFREMSI